MTIAANKDAELVVIGGGPLISAQHFTCRSDDGLVELNVVMGLTREPTDETVVRADFAEVGRMLRKLADAFEHAQLNVSVGKPVGKS